VRVLLDECLPRKLGRELAGHSVSTVSERGWSGVKNGKLLALAAGQCDVFITIDRLLAIQHTVPPSLAVITLQASSNRLSALLPLVPSLREALDIIQPGQLLRLGV
jgi:predicted nuclease of predicted toxin-antitoxin system